MILFASDDLWRIAGWTMLHYLWLGAALGLIAFAVRRAVRRFSPQVRYGAAAACLALMAAAPVGIACYMFARERADDNALAIAANPADHTLAARRTIAPPLPPYLFRESPTSTETAVYGPSEAPAFTARWRGLFDQIALLLPWAWLFGTPLVLLVVMSGLFGAERMRKGARLVVDGPAALAFQRAADAIRISRVVALAVSDRVVSPLVLGIVKPIVLLPAAALAGWSPAQLEMILLHELAHVRRWDNLVNLLERIVEAVLFYQPAVWLVSSWVRLEREHCCDAAVLACGNEPQEYAETLASLAMPGISPQYAAAALASHQLVSRIRHILQVEDRSMKLSRKTLLTVAGFSLIVCSLVAAYANQRENAATQPNQESISGDNANKAKSDPGPLQSDATLKEAESRMESARERSKVVQDGYRSGTVTYDLYLDGLLKEAEAVQNYARAFEQGRASRRRLDSTGVPPAELKALEFRWPNDQVRAGDVLVPLEATVDQPASTAATAGNSVTETKAPPAAPTGEGWVVQLSGLHYHKGHERAEVERLQTRVQQLNDLTATLRAQANLISGGKGEQMVKTAEEELAAAQQQLTQAQALLEQSLAQANVAQQQQAAVLAEQSAANVAVQVLGPQSIAYDDNLLRWFSGIDPKTKREWSAEQLTGAPDAQAGADDRRAWASATADSQGEWIEVGYEQPVQAVAAVIFETHNPGAIGSVKVFEAEDKWYWALDSRTARPIAKNSQVTTVTLPGERPINKVRITIESVSVPGYNQIDAVGLLDTKGQVHWASSASASSSWRRSPDSERGKHDEAVARALKYLEQTHTWSHELSKLANCARCHDTSAKEDLRGDPHGLDALFQSLLRSRYVGKAAEGAATGAADHPAQDADREARLAKLREEIETTRRELVRIQDEIDLEKQRADLEKQRDAQRGQLQLLRRELEQMRNAPKQSTDPTQPKQ